MYAYLLPIQYSTAYTASCLLPTVLYCLLSTAYSTVLPLPTAPAVLPTVLPTSGVGRGGEMGLDAGSSSRVQVPVRVRIYFPVSRRSKPYGHEC